MWCDEDRNDVKDVENIKDLKPPKPPLGRTIKEGIGHFCEHCNSTMSRKWWFEKRICDNNKCITRILSNTNGSIVDFIPIIEPSKKKEFLLMNELLRDAEKYDKNGDNLPCVRILEALSESIENYINKPDKG